MPAEGSGGYYVYSPAPGETYTSPLDVLQRNGGPVVWSRGDPLIDGALWAYNNLLGSVFPLLGLGDQIPQGSFAPVELT